MVVPRWGLGWFSVAQSAVVAVMMFSYVAFPARLTGLAGRAPRRDRIAAAVVSGAVGAVVCAPGYIMGRAGVLLLGTKLTAIGAVLVSIAFCLQGGATGAINAVKVSVKLVVERK